MNPIFFTGPDIRARPEPDQPAGSLAFSGKESSLSNTADGAILRLGYTIQLVPGVHVSISGISGEIVFRQPNVLQLGVAVDPRCYVIDTDHKFQFGPQYTIQGQLWLPLTLTALETAERLRNGRLPEFAITLHASVFVNKQTGLYDACRLDTPQGPIQLSADRDIWQSQVRAVFLHGQRVGGNSAGGDEDGTLGSRVGTARRRVDQPCARRRDGLQELRQRG